MTFEIYNKQDSWLKENDIFWNNLIVPTDVRKTKIFREKTSENSGAVYILLHIMFFYNVNFFIFEYRRM